MNKFRLNEKVWYIRGQKKAVIKELLHGGYVKITCFDKEDVRFTIVVPLEQIQKYEESLVIKVKYFMDIEKIQPIAIGDWIDLRSAETIEIKAGEFKLIPLGVGMKLPIGYEAHIAPRSSTFKNFGILQTNSIGVVDNSYSGNDDQWKLPVYAVHDTLIEKDNKICQFRIQKIMPKVKFFEVETLDDVNRNGFGSTGIK